MAVVCDHPKLKRLTARFYQGEGMVNFPAWKPYYICELCKQVVCVVVDFTISVWELKDLAASAEHQVKEMGNG